jgi:hypothetical protein
MPQNYSSLTPLIIDKKPFKPVLKGWNRLEGRPRQKDIARSLRAEVRDALWMLSRQWQWGEFKGEDAGSPIDAIASVRQTMVNRYIVNDKAYSYKGELPLEVRVEAEFIPKDLTIQLQLSRYFLKLISAEVKFEDIKKAIIEKYPIDEDIKGYLDEDSQQFLNVAVNRCLDGVKLMEDASKPDFTIIDGLIGLTTTEKTTIKTAASKLESYFNSLYCQPDDRIQDAWKPGLLEYQFACSFENEKLQKTFLNADQYRGGHLDWFDFNIETREDEEIPDADGQVISPAKIKDEAFSFLPVPVEFNGMPSHRYWEMENYKTEFADIKANTTDTAKLLLTEFSLMYSNDWCVIPYEVDIGSVLELKGLMVTDTFGLQTYIRAAGRGVDDDWQKWGMFSLNTKNYFADNRIFMPPAIMKSLEGDEIEKVNFLRDEMANMVWAVESIVPTKMGIGANGYEAATKLGKPFISPLVNPEAVVKYILGKDVPINWTPFLPAHVEGSNRSIQLQRAQMPDVSEKLEAAVLQVPAPYYIHEEQVPRSGTIVSRSFQRARGTKGEIYLWIGRKVTNGRGEGSSGLIFDQITEQ